MFDIHCSACDRRQLIFPGQIRDLINDDAGILVLYTCWCGAPGCVAYRRRAHREVGPSGDG